ncbi:methionine ABC transporter ATP-binding protein [Anaerotignum sp. MSJ-24]|uniref:methionine ABC transporter ATP-binding protein n=1 Tax=Anaerotignum sp. MSJ-24 TaxID=2841521 RepID=UPI001C108D13|nr:ATP-binding cassette domain-containing protein [Anaerotignum sp. MSJ-24]MBU5463240.1 ATP-binding cassette domain-containing protein [Anaerotignum sp. MSJ-24]
MSENIIQLKNISKTFVTDKGEFKALEDINLDISRGSIYGIIGMSGAGKSTLVRCINYLEVPTEGSVVIDGKELGSLTEKGLREERKSIGMIFQHFNLLQQKNVIDNVSFPLRINGVNKKDAHKRAAELLEIVGLADKANSYPVQLSGGQQQRVAIARALAGNPKILLCDEATSALDPQTTKSILELLKNINEKYGITIVIITHQMAVVREICSHVAVISKGHIVENGEVSDVFSRPKTKEARELIMLESGENTWYNESSEDDNCVRIVFTENSAYEPVISNMIKKFNCDVSIYQADTKKINGKTTGEMIIGLPKDEELSRQLKDYLTEKGIIVEEAR